MASQTRSSKATEHRTSRYVQGGTTDVHSTRLGWWERRNIPTNYDDVRITIQPHEQGRPDLIAYRVYKKASLSWLVLQYNNIVDPVEELVTGAEILLPSQGRLIMSIMTKSTGGKVL